jgi:AraC-like DNA-binding protein
MATVLSPLVARGRRLRERTILERDYRAFRRRYGATPSDVRASLINRPGPHQFSKDEG